MIVFVQSNSGFRLCPNEIEFITLPHPKSLNEIVFGVLDDVIMELQSIQPRKYGSFFIDDRISSSNVLHLASPVDPRFLVLPYFEQHSSKFSPIDQVVSCNIPLKNCLSWKLSEICDVNDKFGPEMTLYRLNESKVLQWLQDKVTRTSEILHAKESQMKSNQIVNSFRNIAQSSKSMPQHDEDQRGVNLEDTKLALQVITEYLSESMTAKLLKCYNFSLDDITKISGCSNLDSEENNIKTDWQKRLEIENEVNAYSGLSKSVAPVDEKSSSDNKRQKVGDGKAVPGKFGNNHGGKKASNNSSGKLLAGQKSVMNFFTAKK